MEIRNIDKNDVKEIIDLIDKCKPFVVPYNMYVYWFLQNYYCTTCKVIEYEDRIVGYIGAMPSIDKNTLFIWQVCIDGDFRGRGFGEALLASIRDEAIKLGFSNLQFSISDENLKSQMLFKKFAKKNDMNFLEIERIRFEELTEIVFQINLCPEFKQL